MSYIRKIIGSDEKLIGIARLHWIYIAQGVLWLVACLAVVQLFDMSVNYLLSFLPSASENSAIPLLMINSWLRPFALILGGFICAVYVIKALTTEIGMTTRRIIYKRGWMFINTKEIEIEEIRGENLDLGYLGRILDYGYLNLDCRFIGDVSLPAIEKPAQFLRALHKMRAETPETALAAIGDKLPAASVESVTDGHPGLNHDTPALQKDEHLDQTEVIAQVVAEALRQMPTAPQAAVNNSTVSAIIEQIMPAMVEQVAAKVKEQVTEKVSEEMDARGIVPTQEHAATDPMADKSRLDPEIQDAELLKEFDEAASIANENDPEAPQPKHAIH